MIKQKLQYLAKIFKSIFQDIKSKEQIKFNRWHLHIPIGFIIGIIVHLILNLTYVGIPIVFKFILSAFATFWGLWLFEFLQRTGRIIDEKEKFESEKDLFAGWIPSLIGIIITIIILL